MQLAEVLQRNQHRLADAAQCALTCYSAHAPATLCCAPDASSASGLDVSTVVLTNAIHLSRGATLWLYEQQNTYTSDLRFTCAQDAHTAAFSTHCTYMQVHVQLAVHLRADAHAATITRICTQLICTKLHSYV